MSVVLIGTQKFRLYALFLTISFKTFVYAPGFANYSLGTNALRQSLLHTFTLKMTLTLLEGAVGPVV
jgi:hypothetical protein